MYLCPWPRRDTIIQNMTTQFKKDFPNTLAYIDCAELKTERPSSLPSQSQLYSDYKSTTTLKALIAINPRGSFMFTSALFSGSISDKEICKTGGFFQLLQDLKDCGKILKNDAIMADKGFVIEEEMKELDLQLDIPPFASVKCLLVMYVKHEKLQNIEFMWKEQSTE